MATDGGDREGLVQPADRRQSERFFHVLFQATPALGLMWSNSLRMRATLFCHRSYSRP